MSAAQDNPVRAFGEIPELIHEKGRVAGFERMRDITLERWEDLSARMNPYSVLKLAIESDRHAMFSQLAEEKAKSGFDRTYYDKFQDYLAGNVDMAPVPDSAAAGFSGLELGESDTSEPEGES